MRPNPHRGEVWWADLQAVRGHEQGGDRPVLVLSVDKLNHGPADLVVVLPITKTDRRIPSHIRIQGQGGLKDTSFVICEQPRCISKERLRRLSGTVDSKTMLDVSYAVSAILGL